MTQKKEIAIHCKIVSINAYILQPVEKFRMFTSQSIPQRIILHISLESFQCTGFIDYLVIIARLKKGDVSMLRKYSLQILSTLYLELVYDFSKVNICILLYIKQKMDMVGHDAIPHDIYP